MTAGALGSQLHALRRLALGWALFFLGVFLVGAARLQPPELLHPPAHEVGTCGTGADLLPSILELVILAAVFASAVSFGWRTLRLGPRGSDGGSPTRGWLVRTLAALGALASTLPVALAASVATAAADTDRVGPSPLPGMLVFGGALAAVGLACGLFFSASRAPWWLGWPLCFAAPTAVYYASLPIGRAFLFLPDSLALGLWLPSWLAATLIVGSLTLSQEQAWGRRLRLTLAVVAVGVVASLASMLALAAVLERSEHSPAALVSPSGEAALVGVSPGGAWLVELASGRRRFVHAERGAFSYNAWSGDGTRLAVAHRVGPLGTAASLAQIEVWALEAGGFVQRVHRVVRGHFQALGWVGDRLLVGTWGRLEHPERFAVELAFVEADGRLVEVEAAPPPILPVRIVVGRQVFVVEETREPGHVVRRLDPATLRLEEKPVLSLDADETSVDAPLSPSGRFWLSERSTGSYSEGSHRWLVVRRDLTTGAATVVADGIDPCWLKDDSLAWVGEGPDRLSCVMAQEGGRPARCLKCCSEGSADFFPSPDGERVLVHVSMGSSWGLLRAPDWAWTPLRRVPVPRGAKWAGPRHIAVESVGDHIALIDTGSPGDERVVW